MAKINLPPIAPFPPATIRGKLGQQDWEGYQDAWIRLTELHLKLSSTDFSSSSAKDESLLEFLVSYMSESYSDLQNIKNLDHKSHDLRRNVFLLAHRFLLEVHTATRRLFQWDFLTQLSAVYAGSKALRSLFDRLWKEKRSMLEGELLPQKFRLIQAFAPANQNLNHDLDEPLRRLMTWFGACPENASVFLDGSELVDGFAFGYAALPFSLRKLVTKATFLGIISLQDRQHPNLSLLLDHLYSLKSTAEAQQQSSGDATTLLDDLIANTPLLMRLGEMALASDAGRVKSLLAVLESRESASRKHARSSKQRHIKNSKSLGKRPARDGHGQAAFDDMHVHRMSKISQIQDLFPDLGSGFIVKLLDEYGDDVEQATAHLLEDSLPAYLREVDRTEELIPKQHHQEPPINLSPHPTPPLLPERRNIFDNDDFDKLAINTSQLHMGRKNASQTADALLADRSGAPNKAAILSALAAFDADDDERDDTYDVADVGGTVDVPASSTQDDANALLVDRHEEALFTAYKQSPGLYARDAVTRRGPARAELRERTQMTDEAIEGWAVMLGRDHKARNRLEVKYTGLGPIQQPELEPTAWRAGPALDTDGDHAAGADGERGRGGGYRGYRGRGRGGRGGIGGDGGGGRGGGGRGGRGGGGGGGGGGGEGGRPGTSNSGGQGTDERGEGGSDATSQRARQRKEANKSSRANHNRRDQRARKMARGMG